MTKEKVTYLCDSCGTERGVKLRIQDGEEHGHYCLGCWNVIKEDIGKTFICTECGSNKASKRYVSTGCGKNEYLHDILCDECFVEMLYDFSN